MKLSDLKAQLQSLNNLSNSLPTREQIPTHYRVTWVGQVTKKFIDWWWYTAFRNTGQFPAMACQ